MNEPTKLENGSWAEWRRVVLSELNRLDGDIDKLHTKIDRLLWWIIGGLGATMLTIVSVLT